MKLKNIMVLITITIIIALMATWVGIGFNFGSIKIEPQISKMKLGLDIEGGVLVTYEIISDATGEELAVLLQQTRDVLINRIDEMGLTEPNVYTEGKKRIKIELPGVSNAEEAVKLIGSTAQLVFYDVKAGATVKEGDNYNQDLMTPVIYGKDVKDAGIYRNNSGDITRAGKYEVTLKFTAEGKKSFAQATENIVSRGGGQIAIVLDDKVISAPFVSSVINSDSASITGNFTDTEARNLALLIRGGALPTEMKQLEYKAIGPTLGRNALMSSIKAALVGLTLVILFMIVFYRLPGFVASATLVLYSSIILLLMVLLKATLTLPGIAGFVLSIGMAVDANVIIFERIREELKEGKSLKASLGHGFSKAFKTILDSNITTFIAAIVLFQFGSGLIKGFAITLMLGIVTSMFTAVFVTRTIMIALSHIKVMTNKKLYGA